MKYIFITLDAIKLLTTNRFFQSQEFPQTKRLLSFLKNPSEKWREGQLMACITKSGAIIISEHADKANGLLFDLTTFHAFSEENDTHILSIFTKVLRYAVKYFNNLPTSRNERELPSSNGRSTTLVYPYSFVASKNVPKILIDRNSNKQEKRGRNILTVFYFGNDGENKKAEFTSQNKLIDEIKDIKYSKEDVVKSDSPYYVSPVVDLCSIPLTIDSAIGLDNWNQYLTEPQKEFINRPITSAERLEGAAGTGKTLTLILRCIRLLKSAHEANNPLHLIFFTHSISTKDRIIDVFRKNWTSFDEFLELNDFKPDRSILVTTLQEWSMRHLGINSLNENEYLDKDAADSKFYQLMYIEQAFNKFHKKYFKMYENLISLDLKSFLLEDAMEYKLDILQREFSEIIKGQCGSNKDRYLKVTRPKYGLKLQNEEDKRYVYGIFNEYQNSLMDVGQYDSDDIVLTALGQVDSPIWNRRRIGEGYDACFIDETHLFNFNEICLFHHVNKPTAKNTLIFAIDRSQSIGESSRSDEIIKTENGEDPSIRKYKTIFRNTPEIASLAYEILSSGATLFINLENPLDNSSFTYVGEDEYKIRFPEYINVANDEQIFIKAFELVNGYCSETRSQRSSVLIVSTNEELLAGLKRYAMSLHKPIVTLRSRSDNSTLKEAKELNKFVLSGIDYVGGLEFDYVVVIGADAERMPPHSDSTASHVLKYAWYNRLYVAVTRAKYAISFIGVQSCGISELLKSAVGKDFLQAIE